MLQALARLYFGAVRFNVPDEPPGRKIRRPASG
jgi:hypothetical protein